MAGDEPSSESSYLSPSDLRSWLVEEVKNTTKELQLRLAEAAAFVTAYGLGELTDSEEATERYHRYQHRWFQPLDGHQASFFQSDEDLLARIDTTRGMVFHAAGRRGIPEEKF